MAEFWIILAFAAYSTGVFAAYIDTHDRKLRELRRKGVSYDTAEDVAENQAMTHCLKSWWVVIKNRGSK